MQRELLYVECGTYDKANHRLDEHGIEQINILTAKIVELLNGKTATIVCSGFRPSIESANIIAAGLGIEFDVFHTLWSEPKWSDNVIDLHTAIGSLRDSFNVVIVMIPFKFLQKDTDDVPRERLKEGLEEKDEKTGHMLVQEIVDGKVKVECVILY